MLLFHPVNIDRIFACNIFASITFWIFLEQSFCNIQKTDKQSFTSIYNSLWNRLRLLQSASVSSSCSCTASQSPQRTTVLTSCRFFWQFHSHKIKVNPKYWSNHVLNEKVILLPINVCLSANGLPMQQGSFYTMNPYSIHCTVATEFAAAFN